MKRRMHARSHWRSHQQPAEPRSTCDIPLADLQMHVFASGEVEMQYHEVRDVAQAMALCETLADSLVWLDVSGPASTETLDALAQHFKLHALSVEDTTHGRHRPKLERYDEYLFLVLRLPTDGIDLSLQQLSIFLLHNTLITFHDEKHPALAAIRNRMTSRVAGRKQATHDYLAYLITDAVVDAYFPTIRGYGEKLDDLERELVLERRALDMTVIHELRHEVRHIRRVLWPMREAIHQLAISDFEGLAEETKTCLRDCYDQVHQLDDMIDTCLEVAASLIDLQIAANNEKMNEIIKVLTIISTIFMPLGFIAGVYGMNFEPKSSPLNMPELHWYYGYPFALFLMIGLGGLLTFFFWKKGWLRGGSVAVISRHETKRDA